MRKFTSYPCTFMIISHWFLLRIIMFQIEVVEKIKTHILSSITFFRESSGLWDNVAKMWYCGAGHRWKYSTAHAHCILETKGRFTHSMPCPCRAHAVPLPCRDAKGLECVFPIWFTQCGRVWFTLAMPCPCRSSEGHGTARSSTDGLWATCPPSNSSGYHAEFHEDCYQKHTNPPHNDPYLRL